MDTSTSPPGAASRVKFAVLAVVIGVGLTCVLLATGASPGTTTVPLALGVIAALILVPFPAADYLLSFAMIGTLPVLPSVGLPNLPLAAAAIVIAAVRLLIDSNTRVAPRTIGWLIVLWAPLLVGALLSRWQEPSVWLRPIAILILGAISTLVGLVVWQDPERRLRWVTGLAACLLVVAVSAVLVYLLQYFVPIQHAMDGVVSLLGYLRGDGAAAKFEDQNNWVIWGDTLTLRAFSPVFPAPTNTGGFAGTVAPLVAAAWLVRKPGPWRWVIGASLFLIAVVVVVSFSRSTWVAAAGAGLVGVAGVLALRWLRPTLVAPPIPERLATLVVVLLAAVLIGAAGLASVGTPAGQERIARPLDDPSVTTRIDIDRSAVEAIRADPLRGAGLGNWKATLDPSSGDYVHNVYLEYAAATGVPGLIWAVLIVLFLVGSGLVVLRRATDPTRAFLGLGVLVVGVFTFFQFAFDDNLLNPQYAWLLLWVVGGGLSLASEGPRDGPEALRAG